MPIQPTDGNTTPARPVQRPKSVRPTAPPPATAAPAPRPAAEMRLSNEARALEALRRAAATAPEVREARVAALKRQIEEGRYNLSPDALARVLLRTARDQER